MLNAQITYGLTDIVNTFNNLVVALSQILSTLQGFFYHLRFHSVF